MISMKIHEAIELNRQLLITLARNGIGTSWTRYLEMYDDYMRLMREGHKKVYVVAYLCEIYALKERQMYRILSKLSENLIYS